MLGARAAAVVLCRLLQRRRIGRGAFDQRQFAVERRSPEPEPELPGGLSRTNTGLDELEREGQLVGIEHGAPWLADVLARIAGIPQSRLHELLPWEWAAKAPVGQDIAA